MRNKEIREAIANKKLKYYDVAAAIGISQYTFSHWLQLELPADKKAMVLSIIESMERDGLNGEINRKGKERSKKKNRSSNSEYVS